MKITRTQDTFVAEVAPGKRLQLQRLRSEHLVIVAIADQGDVSHRTQLEITGEVAIEAAKFLADVQSLRDLEDTEP